MNMSPSQNGYFSLWQQGEIFYIAFLRLIAKMQYKKLKLSALPKAFGSNDRLKI